MNKTPKVYFRFMQSEKDGYYRLGQNGDIIRFPGQPKFIVQALVQKFGPEKGEQVFMDFMAGMEELEKLDIPNKRWKDPPAGLVLYKKYPDAYKDYGQGNNSEVHNREEKYY